MPDLADESRCPAEPVVPAQFVDDRDMALWISRALEAGDQCRSAFKALREWAANPPKVK